MIKYIIGLMMLGIVGCGGAVDTSQDYSGKTATWRTVTWRGVEFTVQKAECETNTAKIQVVDMNKDIELLYCDNSDPTGNCTRADYNSEFIDNLLYDYFSCAGNNGKNLWWFVSVNDSI